MVTPRLVLASLSGESDAGWALRYGTHVDAACLGGISLDEPTRRASRQLVERGRDEFLPEDPLDWIRDQVTRLKEGGIRPVVNVRAHRPESIESAARVAESQGAILEINAHCRQPEMIEAGCGHALLRDPNRLHDYIHAARETGVRLGLKGRFEVEGVDSVDVLNRTVEQGVEWLHVDTMDSEPEFAHLEAPYRVANNGIRTPEDVEYFLSRGAQAVSIAREIRPSRLRTLRKAIHSVESKGSSAGTDVFSRAHP